MALKGKKKSAKRGSQARRRPASAPRPTPSARRRPPWYRTTGGRIAGGLAALVVIALIAWAVTNQRAEATKLEEKQEALDTYTSQVRVLLQALAPPVGEMAGANTIPPDELASTAKSWDKGFSAAQASLSQTNPPSELQPVNGLLLRSILMYVQASDTYELVPEVTGAARDKLLTQAGVQVQNADAVFAGAIAVLDEARAEAELSASGLSSPSESAAPPAPGTPGAEAETETETTTTGGGGGNKGGGGKNKGGGGKNKGGKGDG